ncbi:MAG: hypothetical protein PHN77_02400 [Thermoguttaceae bacterium]|nr:hypothetical protein [Thermoguttaceae bacterium]MDI9442677.1 hypothetical protein [Planctomycetota bacterium]
MISPAWWRSALLVVVGVCAASAEGQIVSLPPVAETPFPGRLSSHPDSAAELPQFFDRPQLDIDQSAADRALPRGIAPGGEESLAPIRGAASLAPEQPVDPDRPPDARDGMFQKLIFTSAYLDSGGSDGLGVTELDLRTVLALPIPSRKAPLLITPGFGTYLLQWRRSPDLPSQLHDAYVQFRWMCRINPALATDLAVTPGVYSDFEQGSDEAIRLPGHAAALWTWSPEWQALLGCAYLDRLETNILPIGGLIWTPDEDAKYEIVFPKPKLAQRIRWGGASMEQVQDWIYLSGEFGGSAWAIRRASGAEDIVDYRDWRLLLGVERKAIGGLDYYGELGYVFNRKFQYASGNQEFEPGDTFMIRIGAFY